MVVRSPEPLSSYLSLKSVNGGFQFLYPTLELLFTGNSVKLPPTKLV